MKDSDAFRDQEEYWDNKKRNNNKLMESMNKAIMAELDEDPLEGNDAAQKKSLRNQFNFQERTCQTFNLPTRHKGIKTDPPVCSNFSMESTQWMIFDAYLQAHEDKQRQELEEAMKNKKDKKPVQVQQ